VFWSTQLVWIAGYMAEDVEAAKKMENLVPKPRYPDSGKMPEAHRRKGKGGFPAPALSNTPTSGGSHASPAPPPAH
jgi:hypothetical protein